MSWNRYNINTKRKIIDTKPVELNIVTDSKKQFIECIDAILYINLEHRPDRNEHCLNEIRKIDPLLTKTHRIDAVCNKSNGALGCTLSHIKALQLFLDNKCNNLLNRYIAIIPHVDEFCKNKSLSFVFVRDTTPSIIL